MFGYHLRLALQSIARDKAGSLLAVLAIGLGIGAIATMATLLGELTRDPLPGRSGELFHPHLDASPPGFAAAAGGDFDPGERLTWIDAHNLLHAGPATSQAIMAGGHARLDVGDGIAPLATQGRYATAGFFALFGAPFERGSGWTVRDDGAGAHVVVLSRRVAASLFGRGAAVGRLVRIEGSTFRVIGVTGDWQPTPLFYGGNGGDAAYREDGFFLPLQAAVDLALPFSGGTTCWGDSARTGDGCAWLQFWARLPASSVARYRDFLQAYAAGQRAHGRHVRVGTPALLTVRDRLRQLQAVPREVMVQCGLALAFFLVCLLDTAGLLLARFLARELDVGIRRAMGATRAQVFQRFAIEAAVLGLAGGGVGIVLAQAGLWLVRRRPEAYAALAHMHAGALLGALAASLLAALLAGALPAWRACRVAPAANLRSA
jgi:putative ABC transport system permease protein